jgi:hypothetical protein
MSVQGGQKTLDVLSSLLPPLSFPSTLIAQNRNTWIWLAVAYQAAIERLSIQRLGRTLSPVIAGVRLVWLYWQK